MASTDPGSAGALPRRVDLFEHASQVVSERVGVRIDYPAAAMLSYRLISIAARRVFQGDGIER